MDRDELRSRVARGLAWTGAASSIVGVLDIAGSFLILAFWITPAEQGIAAAAMWLFPILDMLIDGGLSAAIVQREETTVERLSTVFWLNLGMSFLVAGLLVLFAAPITGSGAAAPLLAVYGGKLLLQNVFFVPQAVLRRELRFKELSLVRVGANVALLSAKVGSAAAGAGAWCYVYGTFAHAVVTAGAIQLLSPFRPRFVLALREAGRDLRFGAAVALREILFHFYTNVDYRVVIACFGREANGLYFFAYSTVLYPVRALSLIVSEVAFPAFARLRHQPERVIDQFVTFTRVNLATILPWVALVAVAGDDLVVAVFGREWLPAVGAMRALCAVGVLRALSFVMPALLEGLGKPRRSLAYTLVASILLPLLYLGSALLLGPRLGWFSVALAWVVGFPIAFALLAWLALDAIGLRVGTYLRRTAGIPLCVAVAALGAAGARNLVGAWGAGARLAAAALVVVGLTLVLLARFQGITPRQIVGSLRAPRKEPP